VIGERLVGQSAGRRARLRAGHVTDVGERQPSPFVELLLEVCLTLIGQTRCLLRDASSDPPVVEGRTQPGLSVT
jgi:hypothetical protein